MKEVTRKINEMRFLLQFKTGVARQVINARIKFLQKQQVSIINVNYHLNLN